MTNTLPGEMVRCVCLTGYVGDGRNCTGERERGGRGIEVERGQGREEVGKRERGKEHIEGKRAKGGGGGEGTPSVVVYTGTWQHSAPHRCIWSS